MPLILYYFPFSPPCRGTLLTARAVDVDVDVRLVNLFAKEQLKSDFVKINPQHTVPTLVDGDFVLWESKAIAAYLINQYGKDDSLYPGDPKQRAIVDQRLYYESDNVFPIIRTICKEILHLGGKKIPESQKPKIKEVLEFLNTVLEKTKFLAGNNFTIADAFTVASVGNIVALDWDMSQFQNINAWIIRCSLTVPGYNEVQVGAVDFGKAVKSKLAQ